MRSTRKVAPALLLAMIAALLPQVARAATVACADSVNDLMAVQSAVNSASDGGVVTLTGVCDFTLAAPHGGDATSNAAAAVLIRPGAPINGLTIQGGGERATVVGAGLSTAFLVGPNSSNVTIRNLRFVGFARSVVAINTTGTTVGKDGALPDDDGLRIVASATSDSSILGLAVDRNPSDAPPGNVVVDYGRNGNSTFTFTGQGSGTLTNFTVAGNYITYAPPGAGIPEVTAIDVRQRFERVVNGVRIVKNAVGMLAPTFVTSTIAAIKLHSLTPNSNPLTGTANDYFIRNVEVSGNNLGRIEELGDPLADINAAGRIGILLVGVGAFNIEGNGVRAVQTPTVVPMPGGGIVVSDSGFGRIAGNGINVIATPEGSSSDFGAIGVVDEFNLAFGSALKPQPARDILVEGNLIGTNDPNTPGFNGRGIVAAGASNLTVRNNTTELTLQEAIAIAPVLEGPGSLDTPGPIRLPAAVTGSRFCTNTLDGTLDDPNEITYGDGGPGSAGNSFPGGLAPADSGCGLPGGPRLIFVPTDNTPPKVYEEGPTADTVSFYLSQAPTAPVTVTVTTDAQTTPDTPALVFTPANWSTYQWAAARAVDDALVEGTHTSTVTFSFSSADPLWAAAAPVSVQFIVVDNDFGLVSVSPTSMSIGESGPNGTYAIVLTQAPPTDVNVQIFPDRQLDVPEVNIKFTPANWSVPQVLSVVAIDDIVREGTHFGRITHRTISSTPMWNEVAVPSVLATITDNDNPDNPGFSAPRANSCTASGSVILSGTGEEGASVAVYEGATLLGTATVAGGMWMLPAIAFAPGRHVLWAQQTGTDGRVGRLSAGLTLTVDSTAPAKPVITSPADGATVAGNPITVAGTAEPYARVTVLRNGFPVAATFASAGGAWSTKIVTTVGPQVLEATAADCANNISAVSDAVSITATGLTAPTILTPAQGSWQRTSVFTSGSGPAGATITIKEGTRTLAATTASLTGDWQTTLKNLAAGAHTIVAVASAGGQSIASSPRSFTVDAVAPRVTIDQPPLDYLAHVETLLDSGTVTGDAFDDMGVADVQLEYVDLLGGATVRVASATCIACPSTAVGWEDAPGLAPGLYRVYARAYDQAGNASNLISSIVVWVSA